MMINKHYEAVHKHDFLTKELLQQEYVGNGLTDRQIAEKYEVSSKAIVWRKRKKFGIENKYKNKSNQHATKNRKFSITKEEAGQLAGGGKTFKEIADCMGCSVLVAKRRFKELGLCSEQKRTSAYEYHDVELNSTQKQIVMGSLLGDGTITKSGAYSCSHSTKQKEYFDHKMKVLYNLHSNCSQRYAHNYEHFKTVPESVHFTTGCNKYLYELRKIYYPDGKKIFPYEYLKDNLDVEGLAYWYMDDGTYYKKIAKFCTYGYSYEEQEMMLSIFQDKFNIDGRIDRRRDQYTISLRVDSTQTLFSSIYPYVIPSMRYKIGEKKKIEKRKINSI